MATTHGSKEEIWIHRILGELQVKQDNMVLHCDNQSAFHLAQNSTYHVRTKHIDSQYHFVHELVEGGHISLAKI